MNKKKSGKKEMEQEELFPASFDIQIPRKFLRYVTDEVLCRTNHSVIIRAHDDKGKIVCLKVIEKSKLKEDNILEKFQRDVVILKRLSHPNIVAIYDTFEINDFYVIVMEYCRNGTLQEYMLSNKTIPDNEAIRMIRQIMNALSFLHKQGIAHGDITPENIALDDYLNPMLIDFALCHTPYKCTTNNRSIFYMPPEVIMSTSYDRMIGDMWSIGVVLYEMVTGRNPFMEHNQMKMVANIMRLQLVYPVSIHPTIKDMLIRLLNRDVGKRAVAEDFAVETGYLPSKIQPKSYNRLEKRTALILPKNSNISVRKTSFYKGGDYMMTAALPSIHKKSQPLTPATDAKLFVSNFL